jgi:hypothetical protein
MTREEIQQIWSDPRNRKWGFYFSKADPRLIVPRRWGGWTPNLAHPGAIPTALLLLAVLAVPPWLMVSKGVGTPAIIAVLAAVFAVVCLVCRYLASRTQ